MGRLEEEEEKKAGGRETKGMLAEIGNVFVSFCTQGCEFESRLYNITSGPVTLIKSDISNFTTRKLPL